MIADAHSYVPSIANRRLGWLAARVAVARTVAIVLNAKTDAPEAMSLPEKFKLPDDVVQQVLDSIGAKTLAIKTGNQRKLLAVNDMPHEIHHDVDLRDVSAMRAIWKGIEALFFYSDREVMRVVGEGPPGTDFIEIVLDEAPLRANLLAFSRNILLLSLLISAITATLVYLSLHYLFVRPLNRLTTNMVRFRQDPENASHIVVPSRRSDEIGIAEHELGAMQRDLASMLQQKSHLAALGLAVSKINHDLRNLLASALGWSTSKIRRRRRNLLASAQLFADRLVSVPDPNVQRFTGKLTEPLE